MPKELPRPVIRCSKHPNVILQVRSTHSNPERYKDDYLVYPCQLCAHDIVSDLREAQSPRHDVGQ